MREVLILFLILIIPLPAAAYSVKGTVIDGDSNKPVAGMTVGIEELNISTGTDRSGNFEFENIDAGYYHLVFSQLSYGIQKMKIRVKNNFSGSVKVWKRKYRIKDHVNRTAFRSERYGAQGITSRDIKDYPMRGMGDSLHLLQSLPGMGGNFALSTVPIIRGGNPLYDRYYVDGIPLDYPYHFSGALIPVMSAINESVIEEATVLKGLAPLNYGDNLGNVIKIKTRDVKEPGIHGSVMLDPLVPLIPTVAVTAVPTPDLSVIASVRRSMADLVVDFDDREIYIYDHFCKIEYNLFSKHRITFHSMAARDYLNINDIKGTSWYDMEALTWDYFIRKNILLKSTFSRYATIYHFDNGSADDAVNFSFDPEQYRLFQMALWTTGIFSVKGGYELTFYRGGASGNVDLNDLVDPDLLDLTGDSAALHFPLEGTSFALFSEGKGDLGKYWVQGGMRYEYYGPLGNHSLSFRSMAGYEFSKKLTIYGGTGLYHAHPDIYYYLGETSPSFEDARAWNTILGVTSRHIKYVTAQLEIYYNNFDNYPIGTVDVTNAAEYKSLVQLSPFSNEESGYAWGGSLLKGGLEKLCGVDKLFRRYLKGKERRPESRDL